MVTSEDSMPFDTTYNQSDVTGAIGVPLGAFAILIAMVPFLGLYIFWAPGVTAVALGVAGLRRNRRGRGPRVLSGTAIGLGLGSFAITAGWLILGLLIRLVADPGQ